MLYFIAIVFQIIYIIPTIKNKIRNFEYTDNNFKNFYFLFFNNFKMFIIQISHLIYLLDCLGSIVEENTHYKYKVVVL